ncbi:FAD/NAD(P)-binding protein [Methylobacterium sp. V23]|uniref:FAD/NAD(P)-binding protein n=1 Tax=Methylobacterium sp. V23 TaxID=2044878 RepID=UPI0015E1B7CD|nr:FAD/NAD(P)-binding protein [Methylobacterium sp. V23]
MSAKTVAIIGAGFSGTMTALHILLKTDNCRILLCEKSANFGPGVAYGTARSDHLLNVRASNMSAYPDRPNHFVEWLQASDLDQSAQMQSTTAGTFVSRQLYGRYISTLLARANESQSGVGRVTLVPEEVINLVPNDAGYRLLLAGGREHQVAAAILATGNVLPNKPQTGPYIANPWLSPFAEKLDSDKPVVIMGSGLTMVDVALQLRGSEFVGPLIAISRRGLLPRTHSSTRPWPLPRLTPQEQSSLAQLLLRIRKEVTAARAEGISWHGVIDSLRPITSGLWQGLPEEEQRRFLRHARPWWDVHRHRTAPAIGAKLQNLVDSGDLVIRAGQITEIDIDDAQAVVHYRPRYTSRSDTIVAQRIINATGMLSADKSEDSLLQRLAEQGLVRFDRHRLGLDLTAKLQAIGASGRVTPSLWALGPIGRGVFWECTAVPDIRNQSAHVAEQFSTAASG